MNLTYWDCPIEATISLIGGKWKIIVLWYLFDGAKRYSELSDLLETASPKSLSKCLKDLEKAELIQRHVYPESPPKVEYSISEYGMTLKPVIDIICEWGENHCQINNQKVIWNEP